MKLLKNITTLAETTFQGWGVKFTIKDMDWKTIVALALVLGAVVYVVKG